MKFFRNWLTQGKQGRVLGKGQRLFTRRGRLLALPRHSCTPTTAWDEEQLHLAQSDSFWQLMTKRRSQKSISRAELERRLTMR
ncbi:MAG: hypothetical protein DYG89_41670 [Caldilinea sp. CFX5]|nr:hypothetical protein [Caldilinea sp. CFX5]